MKKTKAGWASLTLLVALLMAACCSPAMAADKDAILIGWVAPFTGPLAPFTVLFKFMEARALPVINKDGGIYIEEYHKKLPVKIIWADSESNPTRASEVASRLVLTDKVDLLVGAFTPETANPVSAVAERYKIPALMLSVPIESWLTGGPYHWAFGDVFYFHRMVDSYIDALDTVKTNKKMGFIFDNDVAGILLSKMVREKAEARGYTIIDPGRFPAGTKDYTSLISQFRQADVDIVIANMITPDFAVAWRQFHQLGFIPKIFVISKALLYQAEVESLGGDLGNGLISEDLWDPSFNYKSSLTGETAAQLSAEVEKAGKSPTDSTIGFDMSTFEVLADVLRRARSLDREKVRVAFTQTNLNTIFGPVKYDDRDVSVMPVVVAQWTRTKNGGWDKRVIADGGFPGVPLAKEKLFFLPGSK
ncbi:MAG: ABC transporter substrate-binding protein [Acidobacteriaceae bacterium]